MARLMRYSSKRVLMTALGVLLLLVWAGPGWGETLKVTQENQSLYPAPDFASAPIAGLPAGAQVSVVEKSGDWYKVNYQGQVGWMHSRSLSRGSKLSLPGILTGKGPVKETTTDEAALAGKGFSPETEAAFRDKHPDLNFALVDRVESFKASPALIQGFIQEGGLNP